MVIQSIDRGFLDGERIGQLKTYWNMDTLNGLKSDMNVLEDARGLVRLEPVQWQDYHSPKPLPVTRAKPESLTRLEQARQRTLKAQGCWPESPPPGKVVAFNDLTSWESCPVPLTVVLTQQANKPPGVWSPPPTPRTPPSCASDINSAKPSRSAIAKQSSYGI